MSVESRKKDFIGFHYDLVIFAKDQQQADKVAIERAGYDEDLSEYGVGEYLIDVNRADGAPLDPVEVEEGA